VINRSVALVCMSLLLIFVSGARPELCPADDIVIGVPVNLSGINGVMGRMERNSYLLALAEINTAGGINGETLKLDMRDTRGDPGVTRSIVNHFINVKGYPMIAGASGSLETATAAAICERKSVPFLAVSGADESITRKGYSFTFRVNPALHTYPEGVIGFLERVVRPQRLAIIYERSDFARGIASALSTAGEARGWVDSEFVYDFGALDLNPLLGRVREFSPDAVFLMSYSQDAPLIVQYLREHVPDIKAVITGLPSQTQSRFPGVYQGQGDNLFGMSVWSPKLPYFGAQRFHSKYVKRFGSEPDYRGAQAYAAVYILADALRRSPSLDGEDLREALEATNRKTAFGTVRFVSDEHYRNQNMPPTYVVQMIDGSLEVVWPPEFKTAQYVLEP